MRPRNAQTIPFVVDAGDNVNVADHPAGRRDVVDRLPESDDGEIVPGERDLYFDALLGGVGGGSALIGAACGAARQLRYGAATAVKDGQPIGIAQAGGTAITMIDRTGQTLAIPSALGSDGASFIVQSAPLTSTMPASPAPRRSPPTPTSQTP